MEALPKEPEHGRISMVQAAWRTDCESISIRDAIEGIRAGRWKDPVEAIRDRVCSGDEKAVTDAKKRLPAFLWSGQFSKRSRAGLISHSGLLCLDFDKVGEGIEDLLDGIRDDPHVYTAFLSPSGTGIKVLVRIPPGGQEEHEGHFEFATRYFKESWKLEADPSGRDVSRLCFVSFDPSLFVNEVSDLLKAREKRPPPPPRRSQRTPAGRSAFQDGLSPDQVRELLATIPPRPDYDAWLKIIAAVAGSGVSEGEAVSLLSEWSPEERPGEYAKKLKSGLTKAGAGTLIMLARENGWKGFPRAHSKDCSAPNPEGQEPFQLSGEFIRTCAENGQRGDAELFAALHRDDRLFDHTCKNWLYYEDGVWQPDQTGQTRRAASPELVDLYLREAASIEIPDTDSKEKSPEQHLKETLTRKAKRLCDRPYLDNVLELATAHLPVLTNELDSNPLLFNLENGTYDLARDEFQPHRPADLQSKKSPAAYDPEAVCPAWEGFIREIMCGDDELVGFLQRFLGYCLSGMTDLDGFLFAHGGGANGKSTLLLGLETVLGPYVAHLSVEALLAGQRDNSTDYALLNLRGARLVETSEIPENRRINESLLKDLTGGDTLQGRQPYGMPVTWKPTHKLVLAGNHRPVISGADFGIWRRVLLLPFEHRFPGPREAGHRERSEVLRDFERERDGIFNWLLSGWRDYREGGLRPPGRVRAAVADYRHSQDPLGAFIEDRCEIDAGFQVLLKEIYEAWKRYAAECGEDLRRSAARTKRGFQEEMKNRGFPRRHGGKNRIFIAGIRVVPEAQEEIEY